MTLSETYAKRKPGRKITGMAAVLLPFNEDGSIASDAFQRCLDEIYRARLTPAVNMDTGYVNLLTEVEKAQVLRLTDQVANGRSFVAGAFIEGKEGPVVDLYRTEMSKIGERGGTPILFQTSRTHALPSAEKAKIYQEAAKGYPAVYAFELGQMFAPNGEIWDLETFERILQIPEIQGAKHSSLRRDLELERLAIRDATRPDFKIFTGNDLGIDMIEYGSDYLLGLAAFAPAKFGERDRLWEADDPAYLPLADALQFLGNIAFRPPVPAYKHSATVFLNLLGKIPTDRTHPRSPRRPDWEGELLKACAARLDLMPG